MIDTVLIDLDDTLLDFKADERFAITKTLSHLNIPASEENIALYVKINLSCWKMHERGEIELNDLLYERFAMLFDALGVEGDKVVAKKFYEMQLSKGGHLIDGAIELLENLRGKYKLYLVSNGEPMVQKNRMAAANLERYFDDIFISQHVGYAKPDGRFFDYVFERTGAEKDSTIIIGDSMTSDIKGGCMYGIKTCHLNPQGLPTEGEYTPDYTITSLGQLPELLDRL